MPLNTGVQLDIVIYSLLAGVIVGSLFDVYRIIRGKDTFKIVIIIEDILFWTLSAVIVFTFLLYNNYAFMGPYVYLFICVGLIIYLKLFSRFIYSFEVFILSSIGKILRISYKNATYPIRFIYYKTTHKE
ncbi:spore cortex biosynthesis protein YabQ [uncultured Clostridium sp.]|uniref:spore cortex biosynthesis protein YabQ n=1 Tax=uncultured Clostridium sp. TaxID=59620 RepID=UPI00258A0C01|nr:spore cortex biosynthesis protein YabQ [uncultured Clostridium sp.]